MKKGASVNPTDDPFQIRIDLLLVRFRPDIQLVFQRIGLHLELIQACSDCEFPADCHKVFNYQRQTLSQRSATSIQVIPDNPKVGV
jgi:hypothetical protein